MATFKVQGGLNLKENFILKEAKMAYKYLKNILLTPEEILWKMFLILEM